MFEDNASFDDISSNSVVRVGKSKQKAFIEINEEGSEAAAVTSKIEGIWWQKRGFKIFYCVL